MLARKVGCNWHTARNAVERYPTVALAYEAECETVDDRAENVVITAINEGDVGTAKWWLERKRKEKFSQRVENTGRDGGAIKVEHEFADDARERLAVLLGADVATGEEAPGDSET